MNKQEIQNEAVELMKEHSRVILQWATGLGKSKAAIDILKHLFLEYISLETRQGTPFKVLLIVAETAHKKNWKEEFTKWKVEDYIWDKMVSVDTYASLKNHRHEHYDLIILDEGHHSNSDLRLDILEDITCDNVLVLSATLPTNTILELNRIFGKFVSFKVSMQQAIDWGILPKPKIYLIPLKLDNTYPNQVIIEERGKDILKRRVQCSMKDRWNYLKDRFHYPNLRLEIQCTEQQKYDWFDAKIDYWRNLFMRNRSTAIKNKWLQYGSQRKRYLGELKKGQAAYLLAKLAGKRYVCFCSSIEQANELGGENAIHSEKKKESLAIIDKFNSKEINSLYAVGMIQEGQNLTDIEAGVIIQLDGQERAFVQKSGRAMRADEPEIYIMYYKGTRDEEYLNKALEGIDPEYITVVNNLTEF